MEPPLQCVPGTYFDSSFAMLQSAYTHMHGTCKPSHSPGSLHGGGCCATARYANALSFMTSGSCSNTSHLDTDISRLQAAYSIPSKTPWGFKVQSRIWPVSMYHQIRHILSHASDHNEAASRCPWIPSCSLSPTAVYDNSKSIRNNGQHCLRG